MDLTQHLLRDEGSSTLLQLTPNDLCSLSRVSKSLQLGATPALYRVVHLVFRIMRHSSMAYPHQLDNYADCARRQCIFCKTIQQRPELAQQVRKISWTLSFERRPYPPLSEPEAFYRMLHPEDLSDSAKLKIKNASDLKPRIVWETFLLLKEVHTLDLRMHNDWTLSLVSSADLPPAILFPKAQAIRLHGLTTPDFTATILSHSTSRVKKLDIDHLMVGNMYTDGPQSYVGWSKFVQEALPSLTSLTFRKRGAFSPREAFNAAEEQEAFVELARALEVARESIQHICIMSTSADYGCVAYSIGPGEEPVSQRHFRELLVPT